VQDLQSIERLRRLSLAAGPPGCEDEVRAIVRQELAGVGSLRYDRLGSLICEKAGTHAEPRVVLDCHLDEVAFIVQSVTADGRLALVPLGNWWGHVLPAQRMEVLTANGRVPGVVGSTPPHLLSSEQRTEVIPPERMLIDIGVSDRAEVEAAGVRVGDPVVPYAEFLPLRPEGVFSGKALDNRIGVALMCETLLALAERKHPNTVIGVGAVQEELGLRGAGTACELTRPDLALVLECTPADDLPGQSERQGALRHGPQIRWLDPTAVSNRRLVQFVESVAASSGIEVQLAVRRSGGTDAGAIHRSRAGVPTVVLGVPARYIHSHVAVFDFRDYVATRRLLLELVQRLDAAQVREFTCFG
jgi:putative aminopeptidase FrvX